MPWRVYRPAIVVGNSQTGEMDKIDGPYYFFTAIKLARHYLPGWFPLIGPEFGYTNIVPVDYVAAALDHIAHQPGLDGQAFHLCNPKPQRSGDVLNAFAEAAHAPKLTVRIDSKLLKALPKGTLSMLMQLPAAEGVRNAILADFGIPAEVLDVHRPDGRVRHARRRTGAGGLWHPVPPLEAYAAKLWDYWERNLDPDLFKDRSFEGAVNGKTVLITGASSGIGKAAAHQDRQGRRDSAAGGALRGQARADPPGDRGPRRHRPRVHGRRVGSGLDRGPRRPRAGRPPGGRRAGQQRRALDPPLDQLSATTASTTSSGRSSSTTWARSS